LKKRFFVFQSLIHLEVGWRNWAHRVKPFKYLPVVADYFCVGGNLERNTPGSNHNTGSTQLYTSFFEPLKGSCYLFLELAEEKSKLCPHSQLT